MAEAAKGEKGPCTVAGETGGVTAAALPKKSGHQTAPILANARAHMIFTARGTENHLAQRGFAHSGHAASQ